MIVSFFKDGTYATGIDCTYIPSVEAQEEVIDEEMNVVLQEAIIAQSSLGSEDCILVQDVDFDPKTQELSLCDNDIMVFNKVPPPKSQDDFKKEFLESVTLDNIVKKNINFSMSDSEIGDLIVRLVFRGNPYAQIALNSKLMMMVISDTKDTDLLKEAVETQNKINKILTQFKIA